MNLSSLLLAIISRLDGERTIYAGLHLLRGKRSGQTLQDVEYYRLKTFFGILPRLSTQLFDEAAGQLVKSDFIQIDDTSFVHLTAAGHAAVEKLPVYRFNGWDYRGREEVFFARLSLAVQTISNFKAGSKTFMPMQRDAEVQFFVREILRGQPINDLAFSQSIKEEIVRLLELSEMQDIQKTIFTHRLVGYGYTGWTWAQLAESLAMPPMTIKLYFIESLHLLLEATGQLETETFLKRIAVNIKVQSHLTDSSKKTKLLFEKGMSMEEIATFRRLKMSTIEDHIVEMTINDSSFPLAQFVSQVDLKAVNDKSMELGTKRLRLLKDNFPQLTYFQLRLILGAQSQGDRVDIQAVLKRKFGHTTFRVGQEAVIRDVVAGKNTIAILPTGSGKSLCYQLPAYIMAGTVLIVSPLVALMEDQVAIMKRNGEKSVVALNSFLSYQDRLRIMEELGAYKFIFISPEMLVQPAVANRLKNLSIAFIVIDEAHCISQWGFDFRPDYLRIGEFLTELGRPKVLALTATADDEVLQDIIHYLHLDNPITHKHSLDRQNISYEILRMDSELAKTEWIAERLEKTTGPGIIYVASRRRADALAGFLNEQIGSVTSYHAGMEQEDRTFIQEQFINGDIAWICATNAFGMGIHKEDVRQVIHEHVPATIAGYTQEVGRAGRDGELSAATLLYTHDDIRKTRFMIQEDGPREEEIRYFAQLITDQMPRDEAARLAGISETGKRVIDYYFERLSVEETIIRIQKQFNEKEKQLQKMIQTIQSETCIRQTVLEFYGEQLANHPVSCCSNCGLLHNGWLDQVKQRDVKRKVVTWTERLSQLFD